MEHLCPFSRRLFLQVNPSRDDGSCSLELLHPLLLSWAHTDVCRLSSTGDLKPGQPPPQH